MGVNVLIVADEKLTADMFKAAFINICPTNTVYASNNIPWAKMLMRRHSYDIVIVSPTVEHKNDAIHFLRDVANASGYYLQMSLGLIVEDVSKEMKAMCGDLPITRIVHFPASLGDVQQCAQGLCEEQGQLKDIFNALPVKTDSKIIKKLSDIQASFDNKEVNQRICLTLSQAYENQNKLKESASMMRAALSYGKSTFISNRLARVMLAATTPLDKPALLEKLSENPDTWYLAAQENAKDAMALGNYSGAFMIYREIVKMCPNDLNALNAYRHLCLILEDAPEFIRVSRNITRKFAFNIEVARNCAFESAMHELYLALGEPRKALMRARASVRNMSEFTFLGKQGATRHIVSTQSALENHVLGLKSASLLAIEKTIRLGRNETNPQRLIHMAITAHICGQKEAALIFADKLESSLLEVPGILGMIYRITYRRLLDDAQIREITGDTVTKEAMKHYEQGELGKAMESLLLLMRHESNPRKTTALNILRVFSRHHADMQQWVKVNPLAKECYGIAQHWITDTEYRRKLHHIISAKKPKIATSAQIP